MGEYADMMIEGLLDEETGELIDGDAPGYPRSPSRDHRESRNREARQTTPCRCDMCGKEFGSLKARDQHRHSKHPLPTKAERGELRKAIALCLSRDGKPREDDWELANAALLLAKTIKGMGIG